MMQCLTNDVKWKEDDGVTTRHWSLVVKQPHSWWIYSRWVLRTSFRAPLKLSHLWWLNCLLGCLILWYVVCLLSSGPSFPVCLLLFVALAGLSGLAIFNLLGQSTGDFELIRLVLQVFWTFQMPLTGEILFHFLSSESQLTVFEKTELITNYQSQSGI